MLRSAIKHRTHCVCGKCHQTRDAKHKISLFGQIQLPSHNFLLEVILFPHMRARSAAAGLAVSFPDLILHVPCRSGIGYEIEHLQVLGHVHVRTHHLCPVVCLLEKVENMAVSWSELVDGVRKAFSTDRVDVNEVNRLMRSYESNRSDWIAYEKYDPHR